MAQQACLLQPIGFANMHKGRDLQNGLSLINGDLGGKSAETELQEMIHSDLIHFEKSSESNIIGSSPGLLSYDKFKSFESSRLPVVSLALTQALEVCRDRLGDTTGQKESLKRVNLAGKRGLSQDDEVTAPDITKRDAVTDARRFKKQRIRCEAAVAVLHEGCRTGATLEDVKKYVKLQPKLATRPIRLQTVKQVYDGLTGKLQKKLVHEPFAYPINLAIQYGAEYNILKVLAEAAPEVLTTPDGYLQQSSLHILLQRRPMDTPALDIILFQNPHCVSVRDNKNNTPLHTACAWGASLTSVRHLVIMYPEALHQRNFNGLTPLQVAQRANFPCSDEVASFLWGTLGDRPPVEV